MAAPDTESIVSSRPSRARGLKPSDKVFFGKQDNSRPSRARGLKHSADPELVRAIFASITGAWIETLTSRYRALIAFRVHHGRVD